MSSDIALPGVNAASIDCPRADVSIRRGAVPAALDAAQSEGPIWQIAGKRFLLRIPNVARFLLTDGREIVAKTGTTNLAQSAFFIGTIPQFTLAVGMFTNEQGCPSNIAGCSVAASSAGAPPAGVQSLYGVGGLQGFGGQWPASIWHTFAENEFSKMSIVSFPTPDFGGTAWDLMPAQPKPTPSPATTCTNGNGNGNGFGFGFGQNCNNNGGGNNGGNGGNNGGNGGNNGGGNGGNNGGTPVPPITPSPVQATLPTTGAAKSSQGG